MDQVGVAGVGFHASALVSNVGTWMHIVSQGWLMYQLTDSPVSLGLIGLTRAVPLLTFPLLGGVLADRMPRVRVKFRHGPVLRWRTGTAQLLPDDDPRERQRALSRGHPMRALNALAVRGLGTELLTFLAHTLEITIAQWLDRAR